VVSTTHRPPLPARKYSWCSFLLQAELHTAAGKIKSINNSIDSIGNRTRDLPACSAVPTSICMWHRAQTGLSLLTITWMNMRWIFIHFCRHRNEFFFHRMRELRANFAYASSKACFQCISFHDTITQRHYWRSPAPNVTKFGQ
jgi:hypothetical protein